MYYNLSLFEASSIGMIVAANIPAMLVKFNENQNFSTFFYYFDILFEKYNINNDFLYEYMTLTYNHLRDKKYYSLITYMYNHRGFINLILI